MGSRFDVGGPTHLMELDEIDWANEEHRRGILACLVKGVYVLEKDRAAKDRTEKLAPAWWESFGFRLKKELREQIPFSVSDTIYGAISGTTYGAISDTIYGAISGTTYGAISDTIYGAISGITYGSISDTISDTIYGAISDTISGAISETIYGAIFEYARNGDEEARACPHRCAPRYVVALRGTMGKAKDFWLDTNILANTLKDRTRYNLARAAVEELMVGQTPDPKRCLDVWLAGHSLGASLALEVGRDMMVQGLNLPTSLFCPPQVSLTPLLNLPHATKKAKWDLHLTSFVLKVAMGHFSDSQRVHVEELFDKLEPWVPNLYVNEHDWISQGFIDYFELREKCRERFPEAGTAWMKMSYRDLVLSLMTDNNTVQPHLLPSATLWKSRLERRRHSLQQWWKRDSDLE